jgi:hypothetical protein
MALGEERERRRPDRQLVGPRAEQMSRHADHITKIQRAEELEIALRQRILLDVNLDALAAVREGQKVRLAETADAENASARARVDP